MTIRTPWVSRVPVEENEEYLGMRLALAVTSFFKVTAGSTFRRR